MWGHGTPKILMVEDDPNNHQLFTEAFGEAGFSVTLCANADSEFVSRVVAARPDIISLDLMIGSPNTTIERDGFDALALLKADPQTRDIPVIILSNFFEEKKVILAHELGATDYISLQSQSLKDIAEQFKRCAENPKKYKPSHPYFRQH